MTSITFHVGLNGIRGNIMRGLMKTKICKQLEKEQEQVEWIRKMRNSTYVYRTFSQHMKSD